MLKKSVCFAVLGLVAGTAAAAPETYTIDSRHTFPSFEVSHLGFSTQRGRFNNTTGRIVLDRAAQKAEVEVTIDAASIDTGLEELEKHLRNADFFDVENHPTITFKSTAARFNGDRLAALEGNLTMRGQTRPVTLTIDRFTCGPHPFTKKAVCGADASATIKRSDFGIKYALPVVGDEVKLRIQVEAIRD